MLASRALTTAAMNSVPRGIIHARSLASSIADALSDQVRRVIHLRCFRLVVGSLQVTLPFVRAALIGLSQYALLGAANVASSGATMCARVLLPHANWGVHSAKLPCRSQARSGGGLSVAASMPAGRFLAAFRSRLTAGPLAAVANGTLPPSHHRPSTALQRPLESAQYTSLAFGKRCQEASVRPSMGSVGDAYDNAMCESFFATLECELLDRRRFASQAEARMACFSFIEGWYNGTTRYGCTPRWATGRRWPTKPPSRKS